MTVASAVSRIDYDGAGSTGPFPYPFRILDDDDLEVIKLSALGVETVLTKTTHYTVDGVGERTGGDVTLTAALAVGEQLTLRRQLDVLQPTSFRNLGQFNAAAHEDAIDRITMILQQLEDAQLRSVRMPRSYDPASFSLELAPAANQVPVWNALGTGLENRTIDAGATVLPGDGRTVQTLNAYLANNAVFCPLDYGAAGNGTTDDAVALQLCFDRAKIWAVANPIFRRPVIDFRGRCYATSAQIEMPGGGHGYQVYNGRLTPTGAFDDTKYLLAMGRSSDATLPDGFKIDNVEIAGVYFDNQHIGGGLLVQRFLRVNVHDCIFQGYKTNGIRTAVDGHELFVDRVQMGEYFWGDTSGTGYLSAAGMVGTGIRLETNDNHITNSVIQLCRYGIYLANSDANLIANVHIWPGYDRDAGHPAGGAGATMTTQNTCLYIDSLSTLNKVTSCYFDGGNVILENPWKTSITNSLFLNGQGDATKGMIVFKAVGAGQFINGVVITGNTFQVNGGGTMLGLQLDTSGGSFSAGNITNCRWTDNAWTSVTSFYSEARVHLSQSGAQDWTFDLYSTGLNLFPFNIIQQALFSSYQFSGGTNHFRISSLSNAQITISSYTDAAIGTKGNTNANVFLQVSLNKDTL